MSVHYPQLEARVLALECSCHMMQQDIQFTSELSACTKSTPPPPPQIKKVDPKKWNGL